MTDNFKNNMGTDNVSADSINNGNIGNAARRASLRDAIYGLAVGDAMGLPVQFEDRDTYPYVSEMIGYGSFDMPAGSWSDDTSLTLATCDSIRRRKGIDLKDIRKRFEMWYHIGKYTPFGRAYDMGGTCVEAILTGKGVEDEWSCGNGSLMRILPLAFVDGITDGDIREVSAVTHAHRRCREGCVYYIRIARGLLEGHDLKELIDEIIPAESEYARLRGIENLSRDEIRSSGYIIDTFEAAVWCVLTTDSYRECILKAVNLGDDTDTVGAVAGGLAGILYGYDQIPGEWIAELQAKETIEECLF